MYKKSEGVTLISLVITVIVMFILIGVTIESGTELLRTSKFKTIQTNMMLIQSRAEVVYEKYTFDGTLSFNADQEAVIDVSPDTDEQRAMVEELNERQFFIAGSTGDLVTNLGIDVGAESSYYSTTARFKRDANGEVVYENGLVKKTSLFDGDGNDAANWFIWDEEYVKEQVSDKIEFGDNEYYLINVYTHDVLYSAGYKDKDGNLYFLLSDMRS